MGDGGHDVLRRDCEPHRGPLLNLLATSALALGLASFCFIIPCVAGLPLGLAARALAARDLKAMNEERMDPQGVAEAEAARRRATAALFVNGLFLCFYGLVALVIVLTLRE